MENFVSFLGESKPFFEKLARNKYLKAIKDAFNSLIPVIVFSSLFLIVISIPELWGYRWPEEISYILALPYNYTMGILGLLTAVATTKHFVDTLNRKMPKTNQINTLSTMLASIVGYLLMTNSDALLGFNGANLSFGINNIYLGSKGLLCAFVVAFIVGHIYRCMIFNNVTFKLPQQCPPNLSQFFKEIFPISVTTIVFWLINYLFIKLFSMSFAQSLFLSLQPVFNMANTYGGVALIYGFMSFLWFIGVHGPSIVEPAITAIAYALLADNLSAVEGGVHAAGIITPGTQYFVAAMGGTGATLVVTFMFAFMAKSKQNKAVGHEALAPVCFGVNEPILFGAPLVMNPKFFIPFISAPVANVCLFAFFVQSLGMNSFTYVLPWPMPAPLGLFLGCGFQVMSLVFFVCACAVDFVIYYPFFKVYDMQVCKQEATHEENSGEDISSGASDSEQEDQSSDKLDDVLDNNEFSSLSGKRILVLCAGGGTSGLLASALNKAAKHHGIDLEASAGGYGTHLDIMADYNLVILAPQVASYLPELEEDAKRFGVSTVACRGKEYISLTHDGEASLLFVSKAIKDQ